MIEIRYTPDDYRVDVRGHAGAGAPGQDPVCAAVTALVLTMAENAQRMQQLGGAEILTCQVEPGYFALRCAPAPGMDGVLRLMLECFCLGLYRLAQAHPEHVRYGDRETGTDCDMVAP